MAAGIAFDSKGNLYVATNTKIIRYDNIEDKLDKPGEPQGALRQAARRQRPQLEVPAHQGRQAVLPDRRAVQHLRSGRVRQDLPDEPRRQRHRDDRLRRAQHGRLRLRSEDRRPLVHRQRPRLAERGVPNDELNRVDAAGQAALRLPVLPPGQHARSGIRLGQVVRRLRQAGGPARAARRLARPEVLHRQDVPGEVPGRDVHRPPRPVEPHQEVRRRLGRLARRQGRRARSSRS